MPIHDWTKVDAGAFLDHHQVWLGLLRIALNDGILPKGYYAQVEQRAQSWEPEVVALDSTDPTTLNGAGLGHETSGGVLTATMSPPRTRLTVEAEEGYYAKKSSIVTVRTARGNRVVAVIEIVSPGNKSSQFAIDNFLKKSLDLIREGIHLLVVDLFPPTSRDPQGIHGLIWAGIESKPFQQPADEPLTLVSYQAGVAEVAYIEPTAVGRTLQEMPLFLDHDKYVNVPLEETYMTSFRTMPPPLKSMLEP
jgi:hypothetical protein